jgi:hypothetical protein
MQYFGNKSCKVQKKWGLKTPKRDENNEIKDISTLSP